LRAHTAFTVTLERVRFAALAAGCFSLFWQWDVTATDVFFVLGILTSAMLWKDGAPLFDLAWPQPLLVLFLAIASTVTTFADGSPRFFAITAYLAVVALAIASALRRDPRRIRTVQSAIVIAGAITAVLVTAGASATRAHLPFFEIFAYDYLRGQGLFKDPNVAGAFVACAYPLAAAHSLRLGRGRLAVLLCATAVFGAGVFFSYSRWALILLTIAVVGVIVGVALARDLRLVLTLVATGILAAVVGMHALPSYRYQAVQAYDETGRLGAWRLGLELGLENPLGWGSGSFETLAVQRYGPGSGWTSINAFDPTHPTATAPPTSQVSANLILNGAFDGAVNWLLPANTTTIDDPTSPTGHAMRKETTDKFQDPSARVTVEPGHPYSFAAAIKTDGTPALLIVHWRDGNDATIDQIRSEVVTSTSWTEAQIIGQAAPPDARSAVVLLSNMEAGTQEFTAVRAVEAQVAPPWSDAEQHIVADAAAANGVPVPTSTHNTFLRLIVETGVLGFVTLTTYLLVLGWSLWRTGRRSYYWCLAFSLIVIAGLTIDTLHWRQLWVYAAVAASSFSPLSSPTLRASGVEALPSSRAARAS
jgi:O-antigen ligase